MKIADAVKDKTCRKKAMEIQFNWIFIIIVGTIIILFFVNISGKYKHNSEMELASGIIDKLSTISSSGKESTNTNQEIKVSGLELTTECRFSGCNDIGCSTEFDFGGMGVRAPPWMDIEPIFAPRVMTGDKLVMWSLDWSMPYRVCSILYLTTPGYQYVLVYDDNPATYQFSKDLLKELRKNKFIVVQSKNLSSIGSVKAVGDVFTKYVFLFNPPAGSSYTLSESVIQSKRWDVMYILPGMDPLKSGEIYYSKPSAEKKVPDTAHKGYYLGVPMLIGAIYTDDFDYYSCSVHKIMLKYRDLNAIYLAKTKAINDYYMAESDSCSFYSNSDVTAYFSSINGSIRSYLTEGDFGQYAPKMATDAAEIDGYNYEAKNRDCAELY
jgi:hypothetical protein